MGHTSGPLLIFVDTDWITHPVVQEWRAKGHVVESIVGNPDLILSRRAWRWDDEQWPHAEVPLKAARKTRKAQGKEKAQG
jgi:hypothetical protein